MEFCIIEYLSYLLQDRSLVSRFSRTDSYSLQLCVIRKCGHHFTAGVSSTIRHVSNDANVRVFFHSTSGRWWTMVHITSCPIHHLQLGVSSFQLDHNAARVQKKECNSIFVYFRNVDFSKFPFKWDTIIMQDDTADAFIVPITLYLVAFAIVYLAGLLVWVSMTSSVDFYKKYFSE